MARRDGAGPPQRPAGSPGVGIGVVQIVLDPNEIDIVKPGDILVAEMTTPDFVPAMKRAAAIVTDRGGRTCHAAIVSRELGIPCVVGAGARHVSRSHVDAEVTVDGSHGQGLRRPRRGAAGLVRAPEGALRHGLDLKTTTKLYVNLAEPELADRVAARNVDGVGLLRAEFIVAQIGKHPRHVHRRGPRRGVHRAAGRRASGSSARPSTRGPSSTA